MHRLLYDLRLAAASRGYALLTCTSDVDHDGFDLVLEDRDIVRKLQVKTVWESDSKSWKLHPGLIRPERHSVNAFGFEGSPVGEGVEGGFILIELSVKNDALEAEYSYTDLHVLEALELEILPAKDGKTKNALRRVMKTLRKKEVDRVSIPKGLLVRAASPSALLALCGFHSLVDCDWREHVRKVAEMQYLPKTQPTNQKAQPSPADRQTYEDLARNGLKPLVV